MAEMPGRGLVLVGALVVGAICVGLASAAPVAGHEAHGRPARIQHGTCDALGGVAFQLTGVGAAVGLDGEATPEPEIVGAPAAAPVSLSVTTVEAGLTDIVAGGHAIVVYASDEAMDEVIACGEIGGPMLGEALVVGIREVDGSGYSGIAVLEPEGTGVRVTVSLGEGLGGAAGGAASAEHDHEAATPAGHDHDHATPTA